jgi:hypothetical protein
MHTARYAVGLAVFALALSSPYAAHGLTFGGGGGSAAEEDALYLPRSCSARRTQAFSPQML